MVRQRIESYAVSKYESGSEHVSSVYTDCLRLSKKGMSLVMTRLQSRQPLSDTAEFYPPPPPHFGEEWSAVKSPTDA
jgi:hypothetical protein